jgi:hypothetical protein
MDDKCGLKVDWVQDAASGMSGGEVKAIPIENGGCRIRRMAITPSWPDLHHLDHVFLSATLSDTWQFNRGMLLKYPSAQCSRCG